MPFRPAAPRSASSKPAPTQPPRALGDHHLTGSCHVLQTRRQVRACRRPPPAPAPRPRPRGRRPRPGRSRCRRALPAARHPDCELRDRLGLRRQPGTYSALRLVLVRPRPAEIGQDAVAHEFRDVTFEARDLAGHRVLIGADHLAHVLGIEPRRQRRRAHQIDEHHRELPALPASVGRASSGSAQRSGIGRWMRLRPARRWH